MKLFKLQNNQFSKILSDIKEYLTKAVGTSTNINQSSVFGQLITIISGVAHNIMCYIEDALTEQNKYTAQRKKSIYALAAQSGYKPSLGRAAGVWVRLAHKVNNQNGIDVIIHDKIRLNCSQNGLNYVLDLKGPAVTISTSNGFENEYYYAIQGHYESQRFVSRGNLLQVQNIKYIGFIDTTYLQVFVDGEEWSQAESLYDMHAQQKSFTTRFNPISGLDIIFGNKTHGMVPPENSIIECRYLLHDGENGNIKVDGNTKFVFMELIKTTNGVEIDGNALFDVRIATNDSVVTGSDPEDISQVRNMIGFNSRACVLASPENYKAFLNRFSFVGYNRTWSDQGSMFVKSIIMRNYKLAMDSGLSYYELVDSDFILTDTQKSSIKNALESSGAMLAGTAYDIVDIELHKYVAFIYIKLKNNTIDKQVLSQTIKNLIAAFFGDIQSDQFIPKSDIITLIKSNIPEVDGVDVYFLSKENEDAIREGTYTAKEYTWDPSTSTYHKVEHEVTIYAGENPNLGFDAHGNILLNSDEQFPVIMGGWLWRNSDGQDIVTEPVTIVYE